jgi:hypothetical protein
LTGGEAYIAGGLGVLSGFLPLVLMVLVLKKKKIFYPFCQWQTQGISMSARILAQRS